MKFHDKNIVSWLVVGLGNPGVKLENSRHNVGFFVIDALAERNGINVRQVKFQALTRKTVIGNQSVLLMKPTTFMNLSGKAVEEAVQFYKIPADHVLIISDDVDLPVGKIRIRKAGSAGGHNGLKSIIRALGTEQFPRLKIGIGGKANPEDSLADWVLGTFSEEDRKKIDAAVERSCEAISFLLSEGVEKAMNCYNGNQRTAEEKPG